MTTPAEDAAWLRIIFYGICQEMFAVYEGRTGLLKNWRQSSEDARLQELWHTLYLAMIETDVGQDVLDEIASLREQVRKLENRVVELNRQVQDGVKPVCQLEVRG